VVPVATPPSQRANQLPLDLRVVDWPRAEAPPAAAERPPQRAPQRQQQRR